MFLTVYSICRYDINLSYYLHQLIKLVVVVFARFYLLLNRLWKTCSAFVKLNFKVRLNWNGSVSCHTASQPYLEAYTRYGLHLFLLSEKFLSILNSHDTAPKVVYIFSNNFLSLSKNCLSQQFIGYGNVFPTITSKFDSFIIFDFQTNSRCPYIIVYLIINPFIFCVRIHAWYILKTFIFSEKKPTNNYKVLRTKYYLNTP